MIWKNLETLAQFESIIDDSFSQTILIFKHSTRCVISINAKDRLERQWKPDKSQNITCYYLDLLQYRDISNTLASKLEITHQSPQVLIIKNGVSVFDVSHIGIQFDSIQKFF